MAGWGVCDHLKPEVHGLPHLARPRGPGELREVGRHHHHAVAAAADADAHQEALRVEKKGGKATGRGWGERALAAAVAGSPPPSMCVSRRREGGGERAVGHRCF